MEDPKVKELAETLKKSNLAASMSEAIEKAKSILSVDTIKSDNLQGKNEERFKSPDSDIKNEDVSLNELMREVNISSKEVEEQEKNQLEHLRAEIDKIRGGIKHAEKSPEKIEDIKRGVEKVKDDVNKIMDLKAKEDLENESQPEQKDMFEEEKKIDLTKIFGNKK